MDLGTCIKRTVETPALPPLTFIHSLNTEYRTVVQERQRQHRPGWQWCCGVVRFLDEVVKVNPSVANNQMSILRHLTDTLEISLHCRLSSVF